MPRKANKHSLTALTKLNIQKELGKMLKNNHIDEENHDLVLAETHNMLDNLSLEDLKQKGITKSIIHQAQDGKGIHDIYKRVKENLSERAKHFSEDALKSLSVTGIKKLATSGVHSERKKLVKQQRGFRHINIIENKIKQLQDANNNLFSKKQQLERDTLTETDDAVADLKVKEIADISEVINKNNDELEQLTKTEFESLQSLHNENTQQPSNQDIEERQQSNEMTLSPEVVQFGQYIVHIMQQQQQPIYQPISPYPLLQMPPPLQLPPPQPLQLQQQQPLYPHPQSQQQQPQPQPQIPISEQMQMFSNRLNSTLSQYR